MDEIADPGIRHKLGFGQGNEYKDFAPILGTEYARGLISYHAMPFHRYWFHRTKQVLRNFIERKKNNINILSNYNPEDNPSLDDYIISTGLLYGDAFENNNELIKDEIQNIKSFYDNKLLTPNPMGTVGFIHSLSKNFILCNGNDVTFKNFPNLSLTND